MQVLRIPWTEADRLRTGSGAQTAGQLAAMTLYGAVIMTMQRHNGGQPPVRVRASVWLAMLGCLWLHTAIAAPLQTIANHFAGAHSTPVRTLPTRREPKHLISAGEAARQAEHADSGGRVLSIAHAPLGYRVKLIKNGEVRIIFIPAT